MNNQQKKIVLIYSTPEGAREFTLENGELTLGRGEVDWRFPDSSLSRHHATIYRENDRLWILDNNSTNGTFVNNVSAALSGTILQNGDAIKLGNETIIRIHCSEADQVSTKDKFAVASRTSSSALSSNFNYLPLAIVAVAIVIIGFAVFVVASKALIAQDSNAETVVRDQSNLDEDELPDETAENKKANKKKSKAERTLAENSNVSPTPETPGDNLTGNQVENKQNVPVAAGKTYSQMSETEKRQFIEKEARVVAAMIGNQSGDAAPPAAVERIKIFVDAFSKRLRTTRKNDCTAGGWVTSDLQTLIERASRNAQFIVPAFNSEGISPQIGLYLAMIESEHCVCLQSPTGPLGMFQFTKATGKQFGLDTKPSASPANPDERCEPDKAAAAAARYVKFLTGRYGTGSLSVPLAIASYNSGEGGLSTNLQTALTGEFNQERSFWTLVANQTKLSSQFQKENIKYVPKFFAAAIVGENPIVFGVKMQPVSSNSK